MKKKTKNKMSTIASWPYYVYKEQRNNAHICGIAAIVRSVRTYFAGFVADGSC